MKTIILVVALLSAFKPTTLFAECLACSSSMGVEIQLKAGGNATGYIQFNGAESDDYFRPDVLSSATYSQLKAFIDEKGWKGTDRNDAPFDITFDHWAELVNFCVGNGIPQPSVEGNPVFTLYPRLMKITFPFERYLGVKEEGRKISLAEIKRIKRVQELALRVDTTGMDALTIEEFDALKRKPIYSIEVEAGLGASVYLVYSDSAPLIGLLGGMLSTRGPEKVSFDKKEVITSRAGSYEVNCESIEGATQELCKEFKTTWDSYSNEVSEKGRPCDREVEYMVRNLSTQGWKEPYKLPKVKAKREECANIKKELRAKYNLLSVKNEDLRKYGIIHFDYSWD